MQQQQLSYPKMPESILQRTSESPQAPPLMGTPAVDTNTIQSKLTGYLTNAANSNEHLSTFNDLDSQVDSGHPSLDQNNSPSNETTESIYNIRYDDMHGSGPTLPEPVPPNDTNSNPFVVNSTVRPPNKVILEPLDPKLTNNVPKHLFAAKKLAH